MNTVKILKSTLPLAASVGVGTVVGAVLKTATPLEAKTITKVSFAVGAFVLTSIAGDYAANYTTTYIENTAKEFKNIKDTVEAAKHAAS